MPNTHAAKLAVSLQGSIADGNATGFGEQTATLRLPWSTLSLVDGNGAGAVNKVYAARRSVTTAHEYELNAGGLVDAFGNPLAFGNVKLIAVQNLSPTAGRDLKLVSYGAGGGSDDPFSALTDDVADVFCKAGGLLLLVNPAGFACPAGNDKFQVVNHPGGAAIDYEILVLGSAS